MNKLAPFLLPILRSILFIVSGVIFVLITKLTYEEASSWWPFICIIVNIITILILILITHKEGVSFKSLIDFRKGELRSQYTLVIVIIMLFLGIGSMYGFGYLIYGYIPTTMIQPIPVVFAIINIILLPITVVFAEFPLYFGYSLNRIDKNTHNKWLAIGYPMFFYALQHSFIPLLFNWEHFLFRFVSFSPLLIFLGIIYYKRRRLAPIMLGHGILDLATTIQIFMMSIFPTIFDLINSMN